MARKSRRRHGASKARRHASYVAIGLGAVLAAILTVAALNHGRPDPDAISYTPPPIERPTPREPWPVAAFLGDSYTGGTGSTSQANRWSRIVAREHQWAERTFGLGGANYGTPGNDDLTYVDRLPDVTAIDPDVVVVSGGRNALQDPAQPDAIRETFTQLREELPDALIIGVEPFWDHTEKPARLSELAEIVAEAVTAVDGIYLEIGHPLEEQPDLLIEDGVHPNDDGYRALGEAVNAALSETEGLPQPAAD